MKTEKQISTSFESDQKIMSLMDRSYLMQINRGALESTRTSETSFSLDHVSIFFGDHCDKTQYHLHHDSDWGLFLKGSFYLDISDSFENGENIALLFNLLKQHGPEKAVALIQGGVYNMYLWNRQSKELYIQNDRLGLSAQFYYEHENNTFFTDNQFNFRSITPVSELGLVEFLKFGYLPVSHSLFENIHRSPAFSWGQIKGDGAPLNWTRIVHPYPKDQSRDAISADRLGAKWASAFARYFSRLSNREVSLGLSGGYDSRLLAAFASGNVSEAIHFGHPANQETHLAEQIARMLDLNLSIHSFPENMVLAYGPDLGHDLQTLTSLENAHVMHLSQRIREMDSKFYLDGFLGGAILADAYIKRPSGGIFTKIRVLLFGDHFSSPKQSSEYYAEILYQQDKQAISDAELGTILNPEVRSELLRHWNVLIEDHWNDAATHADLIERISLITRGRSLIANGPSAISQHTQLLLPFMDNDILDLSMETPKAWRFSHGFYNHLWRSIFPAFSTVRKAGTYGRAADSHLIYRLKSLLFKVMKRVKRWNPLGQGHEEERYFSLEGYLKEPNTAKQIDHILQLSPESIPLNIHHTIRQMVSRGPVKPELILRYLTLFYTLETKHA